ncbi:17450_t:CDS:1, partial [Racocetra fulgida]
LIQEDKRNPSEKKSALVEYKENETTPKIGALIPRKQAKPT